MDQLLRYLRGLRGRNFSGTLHIVVEAGNVSWIYEKAEEPTSDPVLIAVNISEAEFA